MTEKEEEEEDDEDEFEMLSEECDEKRSYTPDMKARKDTITDEGAKKLNYSVIGAGGVVNNKLEGGIN